MFYREKAEPQPWEEWTSWLAKKGVAPSGWTRWQSEKLRWSSRPSGASCRRSCPISVLNYLQKVICFIKSIPLSSILYPIMYQICAELSVYRCLYIAMAKTKSRKRVRNLNFNYILSKPNVLKSFVIYWFEIIHKSFLKVTKFYFNLLSIQFKSIHVWCSDSLEPKIDFTISGSTDDKESSDLHWWKIKIPQVRFQGGLNKT